MEKVQCFEHTPHACLQVLYTMPSQDISNPDAAIISESGAMNVFFVLAKVRRHLPALLGHKAAPGPVMHSPRKGHSPTLVLWQALSALLQYCAMLQVDSMLRQPCPPLSVRGRKQSATQL